MSQTPVRDDDGLFWGWLYRVRDHTKQREVIDDLQRRDLQFAEAQTTARIGTWERDLRSGRVDWSEEAYRLCGVEPDTLGPTAEAFFALLNPEDAATVRPLYQQMLEHDEPLNVERRLADEASKRTWLRVRGFVVRDGAGSPLRVGGTLQDITASKNHRLGLEFIVALAGAANEARSLHEMLGLTEVHVQPYAQWPAVLVAAPVPRDDDLFFLDAAWSAHSDEVRGFARELARETVASGRTVQRPGPGGLVLVAGPALVGDRLACVIVADTGGTATAADSDLASFTQMLVILAQVSEREWAAKELAAARAQALGASRAKSDFLATMSHEIRTPLNGVIGLSELRCRTELTRHQQRLADGVDQAGRTLLALVNDILDLSKIEAGRLDLEAVDFDPRAVQEQSAGLLADRARQKGLELVISSAADVLSLVRGETVRFGQVITNLTANAVKFTTEGEVAIRAHGAAEGRGSRIRVEVRDTGIGIAEEAQTRLFEAFTQADSSTTREYGGTGPGLAISKRIVSAMSGDIGVTSALGAGSASGSTSPSTSR
ncbi:MAG: PAS domain-containing protein [Nocardioides sp.]|nr:PAS domain-containing protein [Nocardioides sp.]